MNHIAVDRDFNARLSMEHVLKAVVRNNINASTV
jgi:hypothetical protein